MIQVFPWQLEHSCTIRSKEFGLRTGCSTASRVPSLSPSGWIIESCVSLRLADACVGLSGYVVLACVCTAQFGSTRLLLCESLL